MKREIFKTFPPSLLRWPNGNGWSGLAALNSMYKAWQLLLVLADKQNTISNAIHSQFKFKQNSAKKRKKFPLKYPRADSLKFWFSPSREGRTTIRVFQLEAVRLAFLTHDDHSYGIFIFFPMWCQVLWLRLTFPSYSTNLSHIFQCLIASHRDRLFSKRLEQLISKLKEIHLECN